MEQKNRFEPPFGKLKGSSMARWKRIVDFLLVTIELILLAITAEALLYTFIRHEDRIGLQQGLKNKQTDRQTNKHYN